MLNQSAPLDRVFHALADPTRLSMVERLSGGPISVSALAEPLAMSLPAVIQHLQVLEASGLVRSDKIGRVRTCRLEPTALRTAEQWIAARQAAWERRLDEFRPAGAGTRLVVTEQGAFLDGYDDAAGREQGTRWLLDKVDQALKASQG